MKNYFLYFIFCLVSLLGYSQIEKPVSKVDSAGLFVILTPNFTYNIVLADLKKEYGNNFAIGTDIGVKTKNNWSIDFGFKYLFGGDVRQDVIDSTFKNLFCDGRFIASNGVASSEIELESRGVSFHLQGGKIIPLSKQFRNSGIWIKCGIGVTQHFINIKNPENKIKSLTPEYRKGYDKLTLGFSLYQFVGYAHINKRNLFCLYGGVEFSENFAKRQRDFDFSLMKKDDSKRFEAMVGFKIGWIIPLYKHDTNREFYY
jgi:hypothetical protein